jgi:hypothetical protein
MSNLKFMMQITLASAAILSFTAAQAQAEKLFLQCTNTDAPGDVRKYTIDLAKSTVDNQAANITEASIDWGSSASGSGVTATISNHIDRTKGTMTTVVSYSTGSSSSTVLTCAKTSAPESKF